MARKKVAPPKPSVYSYEVVSDKVKDTVGPHKIVKRDDGSKVVMMTESQAKFYIDQGVIQRQAN